MRGLKGRMNVLGVERASVSFIKDVMCPSTAWDLGAVSQASGSWADIDRAE